MKIPALRGIIKRRMLINFRVDASLMQRFLASTLPTQAASGVCDRRHLLDSFGGNSSQSIAGAAWCFQRKRRSSYCRRVGRAFRGKQRRRLHPAP